MFFRSLYLFIEIILQQQVLTVTYFCLVKTQLNDKLIVWFTPLKLKLSNESRREWIICMSFTGLKYLWMFCSNWISFQVEGIIISVEDDLMFTICFRKFEFQFESSSSPAVKILKKLKTLGRSFDEAPQVSLLSRDQPFITWSTIYHHTLLPKPDVVLSHNTLKVIC